MDLKGARSEENVEMLGHSTLESFAGSSSLHGISHIFSPGRLSVRRLLWAFAFLGSLAFFVLECAERVQYFLEYPHVTKLDEMTAHLIVFPAVTFCNLNEFRFTRVTRNDLYHVGELLHLLNERMEIPNMHLAEAHVLAQLKERTDFRTYKPRPFSMREFHERTGHELREMLLSCKYRGESCFQEDFQTVSGPPALLAPPPPPRPRNRITYRHHHCHHRLCRRRHISPSPPPPGYRNFYD
ncbi:unnamed protein product [Lampetra fluviatilis]